MYLQNHYAQFRWDFDLPSVAARVPYFITADKAYRLYVNGAYVCRGPARGYQSHWPFDEVDLAPLLRAGRNWISVEAYQPGCSTFQYLHENYAGLLTATDDAALRTAIGGGEFAMRRSPGHRRQTARYSLQIDFQEHLDLRLDDRRWITHDAAPQGWHAMIFPNCANNYLTTPFGRPPYDDVETRGIPMLAESCVAPARLVVFADGVCDPGYADATNVSWHWNAEGRAVQTWQDAAAIEAMRGGDQLTFEVAPTGIGRFRAIVIAPGEYVLGSVEVQVSNARGCETLDFQHDQFFRDDVPHFVNPGDGCMVALGNRLILQAGDNAHSFFHPLGFGALTLIARDVTAPLKVSVRIRKVGYPFTMSGSFDSSERLLNDIHAAGRRTQQLCSMDAYVDTPWREQAQWWGDARVQAKNTFYLDGDARLLARGIRSVAGQSVLGLTPGHAPTSSYWCVLPDFALTWIMTLWDYHWQTGDVSLFGEQYARVREVLAYFDTPAARHPSGLLRHDKRFWLFVDWTDIPKDDVPTFLNLWYLVALRHLAKLCDAASLPDEARHWTSLAGRHEALVLRHMFDSTAGHFHAALRDDLSPHGNPSLHDQTLALVLDLQPHAHANMVDRFILPYLRGTHLPGATASAFWSTFVLETAIERGLAHDAVEFIRRKWTPMLSTGTTWEDFTWREEAGTSACHAWSAHPCHHFVNAIAGIFQTAPAWKGVRLKPAFLDGLSFAEARVPSPQGPIESTWKRDGHLVRGTFSVPRGVAVETTLVTRRSIAGPQDVYTWTFDAREPR